MAETYVEITFITEGPEAHARAVERLRELPDLRVVQDHTALREWYRRSRLLVPEWDCRLVVQVRTPEDEELPPPEFDPSRDPFRSLDFDGVIKRVPRPLAELITELDADHALIQAGRLRFETRRYEDAVFDSLCAELEQLGKRMIRPSFQREKGRLFGRIEAPVELIDDLLRQLRRSGLVDFDKLRIEYY